MCCSPYRQGIPPWFGEEKIDLFHTIVEVPPECDAVNNEHHQHSYDCRPCSLLGCHGRGSPFAPGSWSPERALCAPYITYSSSPNLVCLGLHKRGEIPFKLVDFVRSPKRKLMFLSTFLEKIPISYLKTGKMGYK